jgi:hypothetical protein
VLGLGLGSGALGRLGLGGVALGGFEAVAPQELEHSLPHPVRLELVGEDRGDGHRHAIGDLEDREMRARDGLEQPFLAEGVGAEPLDVGHVRVEDDRKIARAVSDGRSQRNRALAQARRASA